MAFEASKVASERSIFSKQNHDYNIENCFSCRGEHVRKLTYISGSRCTWRQKLRTGTHTDGKISEIFTVKKWKANIYNF